MVAASAVFVTIFSTIFLFVLIAGIVDFSRKWKNKWFPFVSFIIPSYNDADSLEETIENLYSSYDKGKFEVFVINDCSKDNTLEILKRLNKKYHFKVINNKVNKGKVRSINDTVDLTKGEVLFILDSDIILSRKAVLECLSRLEGKDVGSASCRYKAKPGNFLEKMQDIEYNMYSLVSAAQNMFSVTNIWGGSLAIKRKAFLEVGKFSENAISEDVDMGLKLYEKGWKSMQTNTPVLTFAPQTLKVWFKQRIRWISGITQSYTTHFTTLLRNPLEVIFLASLILFLVFSFYNLAIGAIMFYKSVALYLALSKLDLGFLFNAKFLFLLYKVDLLKGLLLSVSFCFFSAPYVIMNMKKVREFYKILWIYPFGVVYYPIQVLFYPFGMVIGIYKYFKLKKGSRGW